MHIPVFLYFTECSSSGLFAGAATEAATCPQEFTGGVSTSSSNGIACYSGLTGNSMATFICDAANAQCTGVCEAVCVCPSGQTVGEWGASFESAVCTIPSTGTYVLQLLYTDMYSMRNRCLCINNVYVNSCKVNPTTHDPNSQS